MRCYTGWLFGVSAVANLVVAGGLLFFRAHLAVAIPLDPINGTNIWFANLAGFLIGLFGIVYALIACDPIAYRPCIGILAAGKWIAVGCAVHAWWIGAAGERLPLLLSLDVVFAALFLDYLRRTRAA